MSKNIKDMLLNLRPAPTPFRVPSWDADVYIRALTERERKQFAEALTDEIKHDDHIKSVCLKALVNPDGSPVFDSVEEMEGLWFGGFSEIHTAITQLTLGTFEAAKKS